MKRICVVLALLLLLLPGCGRTLDANTQAMVEKCDAVCLVTVKKAEPRFSYDGTRAVSLLLCLVRADYLGNLTERGQDLNGQDHRYVYVMVEDTQDRLMDLPKAGERLLLFLNKTEDHGGWGYGNEQFYVPLSLRREPADAAGLRLLEALREYGKQHPREPEENAVYDGREDYGLWIII